MKPLQNERGFSLLGVLIAMVILSIVGLAMASMMARQRLDQALFAARLEACALAVGELEWIQASPWADRQLESQTTIVQVGRRQWQISREVLTDQSPARVRVKVSRVNDRMVLADMTTLRLPPPTP